MAFRIQDLMMDVRPGYRMANPECTCQISVKPGVRREPETSPAEDPGPPPGPPPGKGPRIPDGNPACIDTVLPSGECPPRRNAARRNAAAADLAALRAQLRSGLGLDAVLPG